MRMGKDKSGTRSGFTLTEVLVASAIGIATLGVVLSLFLASQRVLENAMAQIQMSYEMRMLRDKLLFRINEHGGLMSAKHDDFSIQVVSNGWGNAMTYTPFTPGGGCGGEFGHDPWGRTKSHRGVRDGLAFRRADCFRGRRGAVRAGWQRGDRH